MNMAGPDAFAQVKIDLSRRIDPCYFYNFYIKSRKKVLQDSDSNCHSRLIGRKG
jgi:hypothetical protein